MKQETVEGIGEMPENTVVSDAVDGISPHERVQQQTVEETVELNKLVSQERGQQRSAEKIEDLPRHPEETVEAVTLLPRERVQQRTAAKIDECTGDGEAAGRKEARVSFRLAWKEKVYLFSKVWWPVGRLVSWLLLCACGKRERDEFRLVGLFL